MATKKKTTTKKASVARVKTGGLKSFKLKPWHILAGIALFIVGGFIVAFSRAASDKAQNHNVLPLVQLEDGSGAAVVINENNIPNYVSGPKTVQLTRDGGLYCFAENADSGVTSKLNQQEIQQLITDLKASGLEQIPVNMQNPVVDMKFISFVDPATNTPITYNFAGSVDTPGLTKAKAVLDETCQKKPAPTKRKDSPKVLRSVERQQSPTSFNPVMRQLVGVARAGETLNYFVAFNNKMTQLIQNERTSRGLPAYNISNCLANSSSNWSTTMADAANTRFKNTNSYGNWGTLIWHSSITAQIPPYCGNGWTQLGENIGVGPGQTTYAPEIAATTMHNQYMQSVCHRNNILTPIYTYDAKCPVQRSFTTFNLGSQMTKDNQLIFNTQHFWR